LTSGFRLLTLLFFSPVGIVNSPVHLPFFLDASSRQLLS
jgi:hypothetical protein